jgi:hypothetical protein
MVLDTFSIVDQLDNHVFAADYFYPRMDMRLSVKLTW